MITCSRLSMLMVAPQDVRAESIEIGWRPPGQAGGYSEVEMYEVRWWVRGGTTGAANWTQTTRNEELVVKGLAEKTEYGFQVNNLKLEKTLT